MLEAIFKSRGDPDSAIVLIRRLVFEYGFVQWKRYVVAFALMGVASICTAVPAYLLGTLLNEAYVRKNFENLVWIGLGATAIFALRGLATYGHMLILSRIGNQIVAENQRRLFAKLL